MDKLKANGQFDEFKKKKNAAEKCRLDRIKKGLELLPKAIREKTKRLNRAYNRKKVAECRQRKKNSSVSSEPNAQISQPTHSKQTDGPHTNTGPYKTDSAMSKAAAKLKRALPSTSEKKVAAVRKLLRCFNETEYQQIVCVETKPTSTRGIKPDVINLVKSFYQRDDMSRISPNVRDCRKFKDPITGIKESKQIRYLMHRLSDVYSFFLRHIRKGSVIESGILLCFIMTRFVPFTGNGEEDPPIGLAKFCSLRPSHVKLVSSTPLDQCLCTYHSNFIMCCKAIHRYMPEFPLYGEQLERLVLCEDSKKDCWLRDCSKCVDTESRLNEIFEKSGKKLRSPVVWNQWKKDDTTNRYENSLERGTLKKLNAYFLDILPEFLKHSRIKRCQAARFQEDNEEVSNSNGVIALLQIDFAENYSCESQDEIQSAHWNQPNV